MSNAEIEQMTVIFKGKVQGVGFRATVRYFAKELGLLGVAENLSDGSVKVVVQGKKTQCDSLVVKLQQQFSIADSVIYFSNPEVRFTDFSIH